MGYIDDNLVAGEQVVFRTKLHWWYIANIVLYAFLMGLLLGSIPLVLIPMIITPNVSSPPAVADISYTTATFVSSVLAGGVICGIPFAIVLGLAGLLNQNNSEFGVTNRRVLIKTGIIRRQTLELNLRQVESFQIRETLWGRIVGYKTVILTGSGGTTQKFTYVSHAKEFKRYVTQYSTQYAEQPMRVQQPIVRQQPLYSEPALAPNTYPIPQPRSLTDEVNLPADDAPRLITQALGYIKVGNRKDALAVVKQLMQIAPDNADTWFLVGYLASANDKKREAYERALRINPGHKKARAALNAL